MDQWTINTSVKTCEEATGRAHVLHVVWLQDGRHRHWIFRGAQARLLSRSVKQAVILRGLGAIVELPSIVLHFYSLVSRLP